MLHLKVWFDLWILLMFCNSDGKTGITGGIRRIGSGCIIDVGWRPDSTNCESRDSSMRPVRERR